MGEVINPIKIEKINHPDLTPNMDRVRAGRTQLFREKDPNNREFLCRENAKVIIEQPDEKKHYYAELIDGEWWWVNGCDLCNNQQVTFGSYIRCITHDVCCTCGTPRSQLTEIPWGDRRGIQCKKCRQIDHDLAKAEALAKMPTKHEPFNYKYNDKIICPFCNYDEFELCEIGECYDKKETCPRCDHEFSLTAEVSMQYSTSRHVKSNKKKRG